LDIVSIQDLLKTTLEIKNKSQGQEDSSVQKPIPEPLDLENSEMKSQLADIRKRLNR
jgi:hypothetical protein